MSSTVRPPTGIVTCDAPSAHLGFAKRTQILPFPRGLGGH